MTHLKKLKTESLVSMLPLVAVLLIFGIMFLSVSNLFAKEPEAQYLHDVPRDELEGAYVTVNLDYIYGCYAYTEEYEDNKPTGRITEREYLIDANEDDFICIILDGELMQKAEKLLEQSDEYYYGERDEITASFVVSGRVKPLPSDSLRLLKSAVDYNTMSPEEQDIYLPLYIDQENYELDPVLLVMGLIFCGSAVVMLALVMGGWYQRQVKERLLSYFGGANDRADEFMAYLLNLKKVKGLRLGAGYLLLRQGYSHYLLDGNDIVWAYQQVTRQKLYGIIPLGKTHALMLKLSDGKQKSVNMSEAKVKEQLQIIAQQFPNTAIGYSDQLMRMFNTNRDQLRQVAAAQRQSN